MLSRLVRLLLASLLLAAAPLAARAEESRDTPGIVSAADPRAAEAGAEMLRRGGSATDAAIATMLALTVVEPQSSGIGGGGFFLHGTADGDVISLDGRETAPASTGPDWFSRDGKPVPYMDAVLSGLSVGVPGNVALAAEAHRRFGKLTWAELFAPAIALARDGFRISPRLHDFLTRYASRAGHEAEGRALYYDATGAALPAGTLVLNPPLAQTFEEIARHGPSAFYTGRLGQGLATKVKAKTPRADGMEATDLASYRAIERPPVCGLYRLYRICGMGPPSSGATTVFAILKQLEPFDLAALGSTSPIAWHLIAESERLAYADRELYLADSDFVPVPVAGLTDAAYLAARSALISPVTAMQDVVAGIPPGAARPAADGDEAEEHGTSHFVVIDRQGSAASYTSTIEGPFGSGLMAGGFFLNNELTDFSFNGEQDGLPVANRVEGGKRPRSSMAPTLVYGSDGRLAIALGAAGGSTIPVQVVRALIGLIDWKLTAEQALALPVLYAPGDTLYLEQGSALEAMAPSLVELGHASVTARELPLKTNAAVRTDAGWTGAADPRSEGAVAAE
jgi:gamma-glutamyltranspeptidase/glutathione hydrolase